MVPGRRTAQLKDDDVKAAAVEFLNAWAVQQDHHAPLSDVDARMLADTWEADALENGIDPADLREAAGGDIAEFLQRTFGREGSELTIG